MATTRPARSIRSALDDSATLSGLLAGHRRAHACFDAIRPVLPHALASQVRPGPIDDQTWSVFAATPGSAAKLRQLLPRLLEAIHTAQPGGCTIREIRVKVLPPP